MKPLEIHKKYGHTINVGQAISLIRTNKIQPGRNGEKKIEDMICMLFKQRHRIGIEHSAKRLPVLRTALSIVKNL